MWEQQRCVSEDHPCLASQNPMKSKQEKSCRGVSVWTENEKQSSNQFTWVERRCLTFGEWQWRRGIPSDTHSLLVTRCCGWVHPCRTHRFSSIIVILDDVHKKTRSGWETVCMSQPGRKLTRRLIDMSCVWLTYNGSIREVLIPFWKFVWLEIDHPMVYLLLVLLCNSSNIVFVLSLHRNAKKETATSRLQHQVNAEGKDWSLLSSQDFISSGRRSRIHFAIFVDNKQTFKTNFVEAWLSLRVLHQQGKGKVLLGVAPHMFPMCSPHVSHMFPICFPYVPHMFRRANLNAKMTTFPHMFPICCCVAHRFPHMLDNIWATYDWLFLKFSPYVEHMGNVWGTYGDRTGSPYVPHMFPDDMIGFDCSSVWAFSWDNGYWKMAKMTIL